MLELILNSILNMFPAQEGKYLQTNAHESNGLSYSFSIKQCFYSINQCVNSKTIAIEHC